LGVASVKLYTSWDVRFYKDAAAVAQTVNSPNLSSLDLTAYDILWVGGGWGAAWDLAGSPALINRATDRYAQGALMGSVCHGALGFVNATKADGTPLVHGLNISAVSNRQLEELGIADLTPMHPETELERRGAIYQCKHGAISDLTESLTVVDGAMVTGQNQNSACETAQRLLDQLAKRQAR